MLGVGVYWFHGDQSELVGMKWTLRIEQNMNRGGGHVAILEEWFRELSDYSGLLHKHINIGGN